MSSLNILNVAIANIICQLRIEEDKYFKLLQKEYYSINRAKNIYCQIRIFKREIQEPQVKFDWEKRIALINFPSSILDFNYFSFIVETSLAAFLLYKKIIFLHASSIIKNNLTYLFCGNVESGKTTIRKLAKRYPSLCDDTAIIKKEKNKYYVYPSPFDRNKIYRKFNRKKQLGRIFFIYKAKKTEIKNIGIIEAIQQIVTNNLLSQVGIKATKITSYKFTLDIVKRIPIQELYFAKNNDFLTLI